MSISRLLAMLFLLACSCFYFYYTRKELSDVYDPWWIWTHAKEGKIKTIAPASWEIADNDKVINLINDDDVFINSSSLEAHKKNIIQNKIVKRLKQELSKETLPAKTIVILSKKLIKVEPITDENNCGKCILSNAFADTAKASAIVIGSDYARNGLLPQRSYNGQIFVWMNQQSPYDFMLDNSNSKRFAQLNHMFNMTMTYRLDSDIFFPLFDVHKLFLIFQEKNSQVDDFQHLLRIKSKFIYWKPEVCSDTTVSRIGFDIVYRLMVSGLDIDYFGPCWQNKKNWLFLSPYKVLARYKFYLFIGNEWHCRDFFSNDIWKYAFAIGAVPVIWGPSRSTIDVYLPQGSYIFLEDFASSFELTNYLEYLEGDNDALENYLSWRKKPLQDLFPEDLVDIHSRKGFCQLCAILHTRQPDHTFTVQSLSKWWIETDSPYCVAPKYPHFNWKMIGYLWWWRQMLIVWIAILYKIDFFVLRAIVNVTIVLIFCLWPASNFAMIRKFSRFVYRRLVKFHIGIDKKKIDSSQKFFFNINFHFLVSFILCGLKKIRSVFCCRFVVYSRLKHSLAQRVYRI